MECMIVHFNETKNPSVTKIVSGLANKKLIFTGCPVLLQNLQHQATIIHCAKRGSIVRS